jgi:hypothetical protein
MSDDGKGGTTAIAVGCCSGAVAVGTILIYFMVLYGIEAWRADVGMLDLIWKDFTVQPL